MDMDLEVSLGLCVLAATSTFSSPLSEAHAVAGGAPQELGVFYPSMMPGSRFDEFVGPGRRGPSSPP
jgi:hypothetical protein